MKTDFSCGVIPMRAGKGGVREFLLVQHRAGHWAFPKGHPEDSETWPETALRELEEETGLRAELREQPAFEEQYVFTKRSGTKVVKSVVYYLGSVDGTADVVLQADEVKDSAWGDADATRRRMSFDEGRVMLDEVVAFLDAC